MFKNFLRVSLLSTLGASALALPALGWEPDLPGGGGPSNQYAPPSVELEKRQGAEHRLEAFGSELFGDGIDPNTGTIKFEVTDVSLPGNFDLPVAITRSVGQGRFYHQTVSTEFGDWQIVAPRLHALTKTGHEWNGNRCTNTFAQSFPDHQMRQGTVWRRHQYSDGFNMIIPGEGSKSVLEYTGTAGIWPSGTQFTTVDGWRLTCGSATNGQGFIGHAPDGTTYRFDRVFTHRAEEMGTTLGGNLSMQRTRNFIAASLVTDVHGNTVNYDYDSSGRLTAIRASDGRRINLTYSGSSKLIRSVTANPGTSDARTWTYTYAQRTFPEIYNNGLVPNSLTQVTQPDGLKWSYDMAGMLAGPGMGDQCPQTGQTITATHPHGVTGEFRIAQTYQRLSYNLQETRSYDCPGMNEVSPGTQPQWQMKRASIMSVWRKTLSAPGMTSQQWNFGYEYDSGAPGSSGSDRTNSSTVTDPEGVQTKYRHYWQAEPFGGKAASIEIVDNGTVLQRTDYTYQQEGVFGLPVVATGTTVESSRRPTHTTSTTVQRDGSTYVTTQAFATNQSSPSNYSWSKPITVVTNPDFGTTNTRTTNFTYQNNPSKWVMGKLKTTRYQGAPWEEMFYDSSGRLTQYNRHGDRLATYTYHTANGRKGALNRYRQYTTSSAYNDTYFPSYHRGTPTRVNRPDGTHILRTIDRNGWVKSGTDGRGNRTNYGYDSMGRLTLIDPPGSWTSTSISYNLSSPGAVQTVNKGSARTTVTYDPMFREVLVRSQSRDTGWSSYVKNTYDRLGRKTFTSFPSTSSNPTQGTTFTYDGLGREVQTSENVSPYATTQTAYLAQNAVRVTDPEGKVTTTYYHGHDGPGQGGLLQINQPMGVTTKVHRDTYGRINRLQQYGNHNGYNLNQSHYFYFDSNHHMCRSRTPEGGDTLLRHNLAGQLTSYSKGHSSGTSCSTPTGSSKASITYDPMGRPNVTNYTDGNTPDIDRDYDGNGNLIALRRGSGSSAINWSYAWNSLDLLTSEQLDIDGRDYDIAYSYNGNGHKTSKALNFEGSSARNLTYLPDALGRLRVTYNNGSWMYDRVNFHANGLVSSMRYRNGHQFTQTLTARQQPLRVRAAKSGAVALDLTYSYSPRGLVTGIVDAADSANSRSYSYDDLNRLVSASGPWGSGSYKYDPLGNIRQKKLGSRTVNLSYDNSRNRLSQSSDTGGSGMASTGTRTFAYDSRGNVTTLGTMGFIYDMADQPRAVSGSSNGTYRYDGNLRRVKAVVDGKTIYNVYDLSGSLIHVDQRPANGQSEIRTDYVEGPIGTVARIRNNVPRYLHNDHLGSASRGTSSAGGIVWGERYTPYGEALLKPAENDDLAGFTGHIRDKATGLNYMQARYQDPVSGRFLSIDPVSMMQMGMGPEYFNRYSYTANNPINSTDPTGMCTGSRLTDEAGNCSSTGGTTTGINGALQGAVVERAQAAASTQASASSTVAAPSGGVANPFPTSEAAPISWGTILRFPMLAATLLTSSSEPSARIYHYTDQSGLTGITATQQILPSADGAFGPGVYFTSISPGTLPNDVLAQRLTGDPTNANRFTHYVGVTMRMSEVRIIGNGLIMVSRNPGPVQISYRQPVSGRN